MKKLIALLLCAMTVVTMFAGCANKPAETPETPAITAPAEDVAMQYITPADALNVLEDSNYMIVLKRLPIEDLVSEVLEDADNRLNLMVEMKQTEFQAYTKEEAAKAAEAKAKAKAQKKANKNNEK